MCCSTIWKSVVWVKWGEAVAVFVRGCKLTGNLCNIVKCTLLCRHVVKSERFLLSSDSSDLIESWARQSRNQHFLWQQYTKPQACIEKCGNTTYPESRLMSPEVWLLLAATGGQSGEVVSLITAYWSWRWTNEQSKITKVKQDLKSIEKNDSSEYLCRL